MPAYITALTWRGMFDYEFGVVNHAIIALNHYLPAVLELPVLDWLNLVQSSMSTQWGLYAAASILVSIPVVTVFMILSRYLVSGMTLGAVKE